MPKVILTKPTCYVTWQHCLDRLATSWKNLESTRGRRRVISKRRSVGRTLATVEESCSSSCIAAAADGKTRKQKIATIELKPNTAKPATTKLNTSKPTASKFAEAKTTANKTAFTLLLTDLELAANNWKQATKLESAKQEAAKPEGLNEVVQ